MITRRQRLSALVAAALLCLVVANACERSTEGTATPVASDSATSTTTSRTRTTTETTTTRSPRSSSTDAPPSGALTITCEEYLELDEEAQLAVIQEILGQEDATLAGLDEDVAKTLADSVCAISPESTVNEILLGAPPS